MVDSSTSGGVICVAESGGAACVTDAEGNEAEHVGSFPQTNPGFTDTV